MSEQKRQLAAIMFTDIVGYTALMGENEASAYQLLKKNRLVQKPLIEKYGGKWLKEIGDGVLASFSTVSDAVYCATAIQKACQKEGDLKLRIGLHLGEVIVEDDDVFGDGVNIASRLEPLAPVGGIYLSESVFRNIENKEGIRAEFVREETLKNVKHPVRIYEVDVEGSEITGLETLNKQVGDIKYEHYVWRKPVFILLIIAGLVVTIYLVYTSFYKEQTYAEVVIPDEREKSIAVLPFADMSPNKDQEYFSDGMMEEILNHLVKIRDLQVISRTSVMQYKETTKTTNQIANELGVATILEGSVRKSGNRLRITVQLIDGRTDLHLWSETYDRLLDDIFTIQSEVAQEVASALHAEIRPEVKISIEKQPTSSVEAYTQYLLAISAPLIENTFPYLEKAIRIDPDFANAYALLGFNKGFFGWHNIDTQIANSQEAFKLGKPYLDKALSIDPENILANTYLGYFYLWYKWDFEEANRRYDIAMKNSSQYSWGDFLITSGRIKEALVHAEEGFRADPLSSYKWTELILALYFNGQYEKAAEIINESKSIFNFTDHYNFTVNASRIFLYIGKYEEVVETIDTYLNHIKSARPLGIKALAHYHLGDLDIVNKLLIEIKTQSEKSPAGSPSFYLAMIYAQMGEIDLAFEWLEKAYKDHEVEMYWLKIEPPFEPLHSDPRWQEMLDKVGFPD